MNTEKKKKVKTGAGRTFCYKTERKKSFETFKFIFYCISENGSKKIFINTSVTSCLIATNCRLPHKQHSTIRFHFVGLQLV